jgi:hypothetical protein
VGAGLVSKTGLAFWGLFGGLYFLGPLLILLSLGFAVQDRWGLVAMSLTGWAASWVALAGLVSSRMRAVFDDGIVYGLGIRQWRRHEDA